jgi:putative LysE/RhtB family amino acid efflux pump
MEDVIVFLKAAFLGLAVAAPPGPIAAMCLGQTLRAGRRHGFVLGGSVASADTLVAFVVAFGLGAILAFIRAEHLWLQLGGGILVAFFGFRMLRAQPHELEEKTLGSTRAMKLYATGLAMTLSNPLTYAAFAGVIPALNLIPGEATFLSALLVAAGVFAGSMLWWTLLVLGAGFFKRWLNVKHIRWINRVLGGALLVLGLLAAVLGGLELASA